MRMQALQRTGLFPWLNAYAAEYGFILRWPQDRRGRHRHGLTSPGTGGMWAGRMLLTIRASGLSLEEFLALEQTRHSAD